MLVFPSTTTPLRVWPGAMAAACAADATSAAKTAPQRILLVPITVTPRKKDVAICDCDGGVRLSRIEGCRVLKAAERRADPASGPGVDRAAGLVVAAFGV